jgi:hypothetical protein
VFISSFDFLTRRPILAEFELLEQSAVALQVARLQIVEEAAALAHHLEQAAPAVVVLLVRLEVLGEGLDARCEKRDLDLGGAGVAIVLGVLGDDGLFGFLGDCHVVHLLHRSVREPSSG